ncbi:MAG: L-seryl-tRNA(Sec) selenium transferase [Candidatus Brocadia carolinensis]|uniref:L-seryl-tRNA(Sec) selenium transferase n=1 Tax=Candidatus Brocadia carolinensis TaxID=1004156 RepID=A0A1V4AUB5_9BACT|nr:MAG: L-seryl-tRNA(Sec) selenium transferase [Candidatus Brocadia caroliniensis]
MHQDILRLIPSVNELLESPEVSKLTGIYPRTLVVEAIRTVLEDIRQSLTDKKEFAEAQTIDLSPQKLYHLIQQSLRQKFCGIGHAINATGIILHTGLGRAPLADEAAQQIQGALKGFCTLEIERQSGRRGIRYHHVEQLICMITGAEAALVVNNNAAAVLLALDTLARGKEVIISRSQLVEIGGSFRMPDVMAKSGAILVEVGTTNKTYLTDYSNAITEHTGLILKVHQSNFKIMGFTETVDLKDLVSLGQTRNIPVMYDLGSGALVDLQPFGLPHEPTVQESIRAGVDIITFSTDKLLGGPQGGIIAGKKKWVDLLKRNPLTRAFRVGKLTIAALEATLKLYLEENLAVQKIPVLHMMLTPLEVIEERCKRFINGLTSKTKAFMSISMVDGISEMGGGSLPGEGIPTKLISLRSEKMNAGEIAAQLRGNTPPIFARIEQDHVLLDMRTVYDDEVDTIAVALENICGF